MSLHAFNAHSLIAPLVVMLLQGHADMKLCACCEHKGVAVIMHGIALKTYV